jgi:hypothetical protein
MIELFCYADIQASRPLGLYRPEKSPQSGRSQPQAIWSIVLVNPRNKGMEKLLAHREYLNNSLFSFTTSVLAEEDILVLLS